MMILLQSIFGRTWKKPSLGGSICLDTLKEISDPWCFFTHAGKFTSWWPKSQMLLRRPGLLVASLWPIFPIPTSESFLCLLTHIPVPRSQPSVPHNGATLGNNSPHYGCILTEFWPPHLSFPPLAIVPLFFRWRGNHRDDMLGSPSIPKVAI